MHQNERDNESERIADNKNVIDNDDINITDSDATDNHALG